MVLTPRPHPSVPQARTGSPPPIARIPGIPPRPDYANLMPRNFGDQVPNVPTVRPSDAWLENPGYMGMLLSVFQYILFSTDFQDGGFDPPHLYYSVADIRATLAVYAPNHPFLARNFSTSTAITPSSTLHTLGPVEVAEAPQASTSPPDANISEETQEGIPSLTLSFMNTHLNFCRSQGYGYHVLFNL